MMKWVKKNVVLSASFTAFDKHRSSLNNSRVEAQTNEAKNQFYMKKHLIKSSLTNDSGIVNSSIKNFVAV